MKLSLSGFLFEEKYQGQLPFADFAALARTAGYQGVELRRTQVTPETPAAVLCDYATILRDCELRVTCLTVRGLPDHDPDRQEFFESYLRLAESLSCPLLKVGGEPAWLRHAARQAEHHGVALAVNNHLGTALQTVAGTLEFLRRVNHPNFGLLYDCMHLAVAGEDYVAAIEPLAPYIRNVLVQCVRPGTADDPIALSHAGEDYAKTCIDQAPLQMWPRVLSTLRQVNYDGWFTVVENHWPADVREEIARRTAEYLRKGWNQTA